MKRLLLLIFLAATLSLCANALVPTIVHTTSESGSYTINFTSSTAGNRLVLLIEPENGCATVTLTDGQSQTWTLVVGNSGSYFTTGGGDGYVCFYTIASTVAGDTTTTMSGSFGGNIQMVEWEISGTAATPGASSFTQSSGSTPPSSLSITPNASIGIALIAYTCMGDSLVINSSATLANTTDLGGNPTATASYLSTSTITSETDSGSNACITINGSAPFGWGAAWATFNSSFAAANHAVLPSCTYNGTGVNWSCAASNGATGAYNVIPSTLVRGDVYYLADGTYPAYTFNTADSGVTTVEIRKAQSYDYGSLSGWNTGTMGSSQAVFYGTSTPLLGIDTDYVTVNGNGQAAQFCGYTAGTSFTNEPVTPSDCGISVNNQGCTSATADACDRPIFVEGAFTGMTLKYIEEIGACAYGGSATCNTSSVNEVEAPYGGSTASLITHSYFRNAGCVYLQYGGGNRIVSYNYFWGTEVNGPNGGSPCHGQAEFYNPGSDSIGYVSYSNIYRDITGSAVITIAGTSGTTTSMKIYDDVFWASNGALHVGTTLNLGTVADGIFGCFNSGVVCQNVMFMQNTIVNIGYATGLDLCDIGTGCTATVQNNLWYQVYGSSGTNTLAPPGFIGIGTFTQSYNSALASSTGCATGTNNVCDNSAANPFYNWTGGAFTLSSDGSDWNNRYSLSSPYTIDAIGTTFTTDRGAYQFLLGNGPIMSGAFKSTGNWN